MIGVKITPSNIENNINQNKTIGEFFETAFSIIKIKATCANTTTTMPIIDEKIKLCNNVPKNVIAKNVVTPVTAKANAMKA